MNKLLAVIITVLAAIHIIRVLGGYEPPTWSIVFDQVIITALFLTLAFKK